MPYFGRFGGFIAIETKNREYICRGQKKKKMLRYVIPYALFCLILQICGNIVYETLQKDRL